MNDDKKRTYISYQELIKKREFCENLIWLGRAGLKDVNGKQFTCKVCNEKKTIVAGSVNGYGEFICFDCQKEINT